MLLSTLVNCLTSCCNLVGDEDDRQSPDLDRVNTVKWEIVGVRVFQVVVLIQT